MKVGIDVLEIERVSTDDKFLKKILTCEEIKYVKKFKNQKERIAGFFCAKEAVFKALDEKVFRPLEIEINHNKNKSPYVKLFGKYKEKFEKNNHEIQISISHSKTVATAICLII